MLIILRNMNLLYITAYYGDMLYARRVLSKLTTTFHEIYKAEKKIVVFTVVTRPTLSKHLDCKLFFRIFQNIFLKQKKNCPLVLKKSKRTRFAETVANFSFLLPLWIQNLCWRSKIVYLSRVENKKIPTYDPFFPWHVTVNTTNFFFFSLIRLELLSICFVGLQNWVRSMCWAFWCR